MWYKLAALILVLALLAPVLAACGDDDGETSTVTATRTVTATPTPTATAPRPTTPAATTPPATTPRPTTPAATTPAATPTPTPTPKRVPTGTIRVGTSLFSRELNDPFLTAGPDMFRLGWFWDYLVGMKPDGSDISTETGLAHRWEQSADGLTWTFYLRKGVMFDQGYGELTAEDVKFSVERNYSTGAMSSRATQVRVTIKGIEVVDPYTVKVNLNSPRPVLAYDLSGLAETPGAVYSKKQFEAVGAQQFNLKPVTSGPYRLVEHKPGQYFKYEARDDYWQYVPRYREIYVYKVSEESTRLAMLQRGELDIVDVSIENAGDMRKKGFDILRKDGANHVMMLMHNQWEGALGKLEVRQALSMAVNRKEMAGTIFKGEAIPARWFPTWAQGVGMDNDPPPYDPKKAKQILADAGYPNGFDLTIAALPQGDLPLVSEALSGYWDAIGVKTKIVTREGGPWVADWRAGKLKDTVTPFLAGNYTVYTSFASTITGGSVTLTHDERYLPLIAKANSALTLDEFVKATAEIIKYEDNQVNRPIVVLLPLLLAVNPKLGVKWELGKQVYGIGLPQLIRQ